MRPFRFADKNKYTRYIMLNVDIVIEITPRSVILLIGNRIAKIPKGVLDEWPDLGKPGIMIIEENYADEKGLTLC